MLIPEALAAGERGRARWQGGRRTLCEAKERWRSLAYFADESSVTPEPRWLIRPAAAGFA
jgi:hypothetical protein